MQMYDRLTTKKHGFSLKYMYCEVVDAHEFAKECLLYKMQVEVCYCSLLNVRHQLTEST